MVAVHLYRGVYRLEQALPVDSGEDEAGIVEALRALRGGAYADGGERMAYGGEEGGLLGKCARVGDDRRGVHLQAVIVVEAEGFVLNDPLVEFETALLEALAAAGMAAVENRHVVLLRYGVDGVEEAQEVLLGVDVLLAVGREEDILPFLQAEALVDVAGFDVGEVLVQHLGHRRTADVGALLGKAAVGEVSAGVLGVADVYIGDDVYDAAVGLLGETLVLAAVARLHMEDWYMEALGGDGAETGVCVAEDEKGVGLCGHHQLVGAVDDVAYGGAEVITHGVHIDLRGGELQVAEEDAVEVVVVVLAGMGEDYVEVLSAFIYHGGQTDYLRPGAYYYQ